jgi:queuine/archaeosine tRNA-ribosyltransferase
MREFMEGAVVGLRLLTMAMVLTLAVRLLFDGEPLYAMGVGSGVAFAYSFYWFFLGEDE